MRYSYLSLRKFGSETELKHKFYTKYTKINRTQTHCNLVRFENFNKNMSQIDWAFDQGGIPPWFDLLSGILHTCIHVYIIFLCCNSCTKILTSSSSTWWNCWIIKIHTLLKIILLNELIKHIFHLFAII